MSHPDHWAKPFPFLNPEAIAQMELLPPLYEEWNAQINVISRKDQEGIWERHILHSLCLGGIMPHRPGLQVLDIGTGGGFPGIPLAIAFPQIHFTLVDSIGKKIKVVQAIVDALGLRNVTALHERAERVKGPFDVVVTRAVAPAATLRSWVRNSWTKNPNSALYALKGGDLSDELKGMKAKLFPLSDILDGEFYTTKYVVRIPAK
ncbi:MAG: 16S rRNA (guanine(527)-N(7))-methyltransferase RsmG [Schleiferiaceae bacterium]|nr:16S rRNA (guanine(527)-N(7))-methyltransferase RsmG [Schleiferiaceae bacterium]